MLVVFTAFLVTCQVRSLVGRRRAALQRGMAAALCKYDDPCLLSILIELYQSNADTELVTAPLIRVLGRLKESDAAVVRESDHIRLYVELDRCCDYMPHSNELVLAILKALERVGNSSAIPHVKKLIASAKDR